MTTPPPPTSVTAALSRHLRGASSTRVTPPFAAAPPPSSLTAFNTGVPVLAPVATGSLVDIAGPSRVGKTALLHHIVAHALWNDSRGCGVGVAWIDLNGGLDIARIERSLAARIPGTHAEVAARIDDCLGRLHIFRPRTSAGLVCTIHALEPFLSTPSGHGVALLAIDSLGVRHYLDRTPSDADSVEQALTSVVRNLLRGSRITAFVTKLALYASAPLAGPWPFAGVDRPEAPTEFLPQAWATLAAQSIVLARSRGTSLAVTLARRSEGGAGGGAKVARAIAVFDVEETGVRFGPVAEAVS